MNDMKDWSAETYLRFEDERTRPSRDLLAQVPLLRPARIVDLGCGPGNSTELLAVRYPQAEVTGLDSSPDMLAAARKRLPACRFVEGDIASWTPDAPVDLLFANAVFQWVPDHLGALTRLFEGLPKGAVLAVQMPDNQAEPSHAAMRATAASGPWAERFAQPIAREPILPPRAYFEALGPFAARLDVWHTIYQHPLAGPEAIVDWVMGTGLRPFLDRLDTAERAPFLAAYTGAIAAAYPPLSDGRVLFRFPRLFIVAVRGE